MLHDILWKALYRWMLSMSLIIGLGLGFQIASMISEISMILGLGGHF